jgi:hypothetical protein
MRLCEVKYVPYGTWIVRFLNGRTTRPLYERGYGKENILELFRLIDSIQDEARLGGLLRSAIQADSIEEFAKTL